MSRKGRNCGSNEMNDALGSENTDFPFILSRCGGDHEKLGKVMGLLFFVDHGYGRWMGKEGVWGGRIGEVGRGSGLR